MGSGQTSGVGRDAARGNTRLRFEQWAKNPGCQANTVSAVHNVRMADVAKHLRISPSFGQSPFALARGESFEKELLADGGSRLKEELIRTGVVPAGEIRFADLRLRTNGGPDLTSLDQAIGATTDLLRYAADHPESTPLVVAAATARIPVGAMLPEANLIIDVLVVLPSTGELIVALPKHRGQPVRWTEVRQPDRHPQIDHTCGACQVFCVSSSLLVGQIRSVMRSG